MSHVISDNFELYTGLRESSDLSDPKMTCYQTLTFEPFDADHKEMVRCQAILVIFVLKYLKRQVKTTCKVGDW